MNNDVSVPLRVVLDDADLALELVPETEGPGAVEAPVRWAHVSELRDPAPYLLGSEVLLTAGVNLPAARAEVDEYVRRLREAGVTALGFGITPTVHDELPPRLRHACARHRLPLLVAAPSTPFLAISRAVAMALEEARHREQHRVTEAWEALTRSAAGGLREVARGLARRLSGWVALAGPDDQPVVEDGAPRPWPPEIREMLARLRSGTGIRSATTELPDGTVVVGQPVYPQATAAHLLVVGRAARFSAADRSIAAAGAALLGLAANAGTEAARLGAVTTALLTGEAAEDPLAGMFTADAYRVVAGVRARTAPSGTDPEAEHGWLRAALGTPLVRLESHRFTAVAPSAPGAAAVDDLESHGWLVVAAAPRPAHRLAEARGEVALLLERARVLGTAVTEVGEDLADLVSRDAGEGFAERMLAPLSARGDQAALVPTLRTWLACHGRWDRAAAALGVHRNSVRHRIGQVERALGVDLADPDVRMRLWFALRWSE
ncbi:PucR family transcriptional regulator [Saccharomonospora sp. CUA-673]|uniref:PucR family transcriptional regulator n=1 Tax=Saccharomonospora sp. CUA-673 TaxID=1904969 RepID=UPI0009666148|nr:PucR family transcriptional regulator [Saccharomonospora sp. CUA-673]OLT45930.1 PucR family transcriptional regulator [Saccharomonospora sp. CUA-673]